MAGGLVDVASVVDSKRTVEAGPVEIANTIGGEFAHNLEEMRANLA